MTITPARIGRDLLPGGLLRGARSAAHAGGTAWVLGRAGLLRPLRPQVLAGLAAVVKDWGIGPAGGFAAMALRDPDRDCVVDEAGATTWAQMHRRGNAAARGLAELGVTAHTRVGILCRNHRGFLDAMLAASRLGADLVFLNTAMAGPQLGEVVTREGIGALIHDPEFDALVHAADLDEVLLVGSEAPRGGGSPGHPHLADFIAHQPDQDLPAPGRLSRIVLMTSGTTGAPKGAPRREAGPDAAVALLSRIPLRSGWRTHIAAPLFHTWGLAHLLLSMLLGNTVVLRRRFDPEECLRATAAQRCQALVVVPVMLQRMVQLPESRTAARDLSALRVVASSGSALPGDLATRWMDRFGENLFSLYGSTEVAWASVARPEDLRDDPRSAGRPPANTTLRILDDAGRPVPVGTVGRIFVGNSLVMPGYTNGDSKEVIDGLMSTGDLGRLDEAGVLRIEGRDDEMVVSGGENVFPAEVEDCLAQHPWVAEVAVLGVVDEEFGQRLRAFVVLAADQRGRGVDEVSQRLQGWVRERLARFKVPREVVLLEELPRNATGKVLKRRLAERAD